MGAFEGQADFIADFKALKQKVADIAVQVAKMLGLLGGNRIMRGIVSSGGAVVSGAGFHVTRNTAGDYTVTFDTPFSDVPAVTLTLGATGPNPRGIKHKDSVPATASGFSVWTYTTTPTLTDSEFHFTAIGAA